MENNICCICEQEYQGHGHNPLPLYNKEGRCCTSCNMSEVIPARLILKKWQDGKNEKHLHSDGE